MTDEEALLAYADGELDATAAAAFERRLAGDPALAARLEQHRRLASRLRAAYDPILDEPIPERLARAAGGPTVVSLAEARAARRARASSPVDWRFAAALAAGLVAAVAVGQSIRTDENRPVVEQEGRLVASGALGRALDHQLSGQGPPIRVNLTYRNRAGAICRSFSGAVADGVACRLHGRWTLQALFPGEGATAAAAGGYRIAASGDPRLAQIVGDTISGEPFDAARERSARARRWDGAAP